MKAIIKWFTSVVDVIGFLIDYVVDLIEQLIDLVVMLGQAVATIPRLFSILPPIVTASFGAILAIAVLYKTLGRE